METRNQMSKYIIRVFGNLPNVANNSNQGFLQQQQKLPPVDHRIKSQMHILLS